MNWIERMLFTQRSWFLYWVKRLTKHNASYAPVHNNLKSKLNLLKPKANFEFIQLTFVYRWIFLCVSTFSIYMLVALLHKMLNSVDWIFHSPRKCSHNHSTEFRVTYINEISTSCPSLWLMLKTKRGKSVRRKKYELSA